MTLTIWRPRKSRVTSAIASEGNSWANNVWSNGAYTSSYTQPPAFDRSFAREWEANPPKGFPTLSPENIAALKEAINRYSDIVAKGGWQPLPDAQLASGASGSAVARLASMDFPVPVEALERMRIPKSFNPRSPQSRRDLASALRTNAALVRPTSKYRSRNPRAAK